MTSLKCCDKCGKQVSMDEIHLYTNINGRKTSISWICEDCWLRMS